MVRCNLMGDNSEQAKLASRDLNDCAMALCDLPSKNPNVFVTDRNFQNYMTPELEQSLNKTINPKLDRALKNIKKDRLEQIKNIEKKLLPNGVVKLNMKEMDPIFNSILSDEVFGPYVKKEINMKRPLKDRLKITITPPQDASAEFKNQLNKYAQDFEKFNKYNPSSVSEYASEKEEAEIAKEYYAYVKKSYNDYKKSIHAITRKELDLQMKEIERRKITLYDVSNFEVIFNSSVNGYKSMSSPAICSDEAICQSIFENHLASNKKIKDALASLKKDLNDPEVQKQEKLRCNAGIVSTSSNVSNEKKAQELFGKVKKQMEDKVFSRFSAHSKSVLKKYFDKGININNKLPESAAASYEGPNLFELDTAATENLTQDIITQEDAYNELLKIQEAGVYDVGMSLCQNGQTTAWDSFYAFKNFEEDEGLTAAFGQLDQMFVSPFTALNEKSGKTIMAHELGHAMSYAFQDSDMSVSSAATYKKLRQCANENYKGNPNKEGGEGRNTEEDTADLIAYMTYESEKNVLLCAILQPSDDNKAYINLGFVQDNPRESHSTSLYRVYLEAVNKGMAIPVSCQKAFEPYSKVLSSKKCI